MQPKNRMAKYQGISASAVALVTPERKQRLLPTRAARAWKYAAAAVGHAEDTIQPRRIEETSYKSVKITNCSQNKSYDDL